MLYYQPAGGWMCSCGLIGGLLFGSYDRRALAYEASFGLQPVLRE